MKEEMTSFDLAALITEISHIIVGGRINNIYQLDPITVLLRLRQPSQPYSHLLIESGKRFHLTSYALSKPEKPPNFCMALRKHLKNGFVSDVYQHDFERVIVLRVRTMEGEFQLISELFGRGNIILVNPENRIIQALSFRKMRDRNILRGEVFQYAPSNRKNPLSFKPQDLEEIRRYGRLEIVRALTKFLGIGGLYAEETLLRAKVRKNLQSKDITDDELKRIYKELNQIISMIKNGNLDPKVVLGVNDELIDAVPLNLKTYSALKQKKVKTFSIALDNYYTIANFEDEVKEPVKEIDQMLEEQLRILEKQQSFLNSLRPDVERNRRIGNAIFSNLGQLQLLLERVLDEKRSGKVWNQIVSGIQIDKGKGMVPAIYFTDLEPKRFMIKVSVAEEEFSLNLHHSAQANGSNYYRKAKRAQKKVNGILSAMKDAESRIEDLKGSRLKRFEETKKTPKKIRKKIWYEKYRWFHSSDGFLIIGGRDATTNEIIIKKHMEDQDIVLHADVFGAPFVLIKTEGQTPTEQTVLESAKFAASYSRAWSKLLSTIDVYWFLPKQVSKSPPTGQSLGKGAFVISGKKNYIRNIPLTLSIGALAKNDDIMILSGPQEAICKKTKLYVNIVPGNKSSGNLAKQVRKLLAEKAREPLKEKILEASLDEIQRTIPSGKGNIKIN